MPIARYEAITNATLEQIAERANETDRVVEFIEYHEGTYHALLAMPEIQLSPELQELLGDLGGGEHEEASDEDEAHAARQRRFASRGRH